MMLPLYTHDLFGRATGMVLGTLIGIAFGFVLERAGFGRAPLLAAQFYGTNMRVFKVMFTGIATCAIGIGVLSGVGVLDLAQVTVPETFLWPQVAGGALLGVGFIVAGYCPGTSCAAAASGNLDGLVTYLGVGLGTLLFGGFYPWLEKFYTSSAMGVTRIDTLLGVPFAPVAVAVVLMAVGCFFGAEALERILARRGQTALPAGNLGVRNRTFVALAGLAVLGLATLGWQPSQAQEMPKPFGYISAIDLATRLSRAPDTLVLLDARPAGECKAARLRSAQCLTGQPAGFVASLPTTRQVVVYGNADSKALAQRLRAFPGEVLVLMGGYPAFAKAVLDPPLPPANPTPEAVAAYRTQSALHGYFTGNRQAPEPVQVRAAPAAPAGVSVAKKGGGC